jgi:hypothetical protein
MHSPDDYDLPDDVDDAAIARMRLVAELLDEAVRIPGIGVRVGIDPLLGVVPVGGDLVAGGLSMYIVAESARLGVSWQTLLRMMANVGVDAAGSSVPVVGGVFDALWKANRRNLALAFSELEAAATDRRVDDSPVAIPIE